MPHRGNPCASPFLQWLVVNIPGNNVSAGETLARWVPPGGERKGKDVFEAKVQEWYSLLFPYRAS